MLRLLKQFVSAFTRHFVPLCFFLRRGGQHVHVAADAIILQYAFDPPHPPHLPLHPPLHCEGIEIHDLHPIVCRPPPPPSRQTNAGGPTPSSEISRGFDPQQAFLRRSTQVRTPGRARTYVPPVARRTTREPVHLVQKVLEAFPGRGWGIKVLVMLSIEAKGLEGWYQGVSHPRSSREEAVLLGSFGSRLLAILRPLPALRFCW